MSGAALRASPPAHDGALWIEVQGVEVALRPSGAAWLADERALVVADLHLEKGSAFAARGQLLPPYDTCDTLERLAAEVSALQPRVVVMLGDSFHDRGATARLAPASIARLQALAHGRAVVWIAGNHDAALLSSDTLGWRPPGETVAALALGALVLRHEPRAGSAPGELAGHLHPCAKLVSRGRSLRRRAFLTDGVRLVLPAFGAYAGGLNVHDPAFFGLFARAPVVAAMGERRVHPLPLAALSPD